MSVSLEQQHRRVRRNSPEVLNHSINGLEAKDKLG